MNRHNQKEKGQGSKKRGVILLEAVFALILLGMVSYGFASTQAMAFSQASALKLSDKAKQYADLEAEVLKTVGFENLETTGTHVRRSMQTITGQNDGFESTVRLAQTVAVSPENTVKIAAIDVYKTGENTPRYSLEVPIASQSGNVFKGNADKNGWVQFPNGVIMQWMEIISPYRSDSSAGSANIGAYYFPIPFKEVCYNVSLTSECFIEGEAQLESTLFDKEKVNIRLNWFGTFTSPKNMKIYVIAIGK